MNDIINKVASLGGTISTTDISHLSEYKQVLRAKERGDLIRLRHGVYVYNGVLTKRVIADRYGLVSRDIDLLLAAF